jgi:glutaredoxin 3
MITIYSTRTCSFCRMAKDYLSGKDIAYEEVKVDEIENGAQILLDKSGQLGVPVIDVDGQVIVGFNRPELDKALGSANLA